MNKVVVLLFALLILSACSPSPQETCATELETYIPTMNDLMARWSDAQEVAESSPRLALAGPVESLQAVRRDATAVTPPDCMAVDHGRIMDGMDAMISMFLGFMADPDYDFGAHPELYGAMISLGGWERMAEMYEDDPAVFAQRLLEVDSADEDVGFDVRLTAEAQSP